MKKKRMGLTMVSLLLLCVMTVSMTGCSGNVQAQDLMKGITSNEVKVPDDIISQNTNVTDFAVRLFQANEKSGENTLLSPLSVLCALAMTANGTREQTLNEMEKVLGMNAEDLNLYLYNYRNQLPRSESGRLSLANSIWFTEEERFTVNQDFLQINADYYSADIYRTPFNDQTCNDINNWVKENTDEMIPKILEQISPDAIMYLVNALAFEAEWAEIYEAHQVTDGKICLCCTASQRGGKCVGLHCLPEWEIPAYTADQSGIYDGLYRRPEI